MNFTELGRKPISEAQPAGEDARYTPEFEELQAEIDRLSIPSQAGQVDWDKIVRLAAQILEEKSKDLLAASYLAVALIHTKKEEGLVAGVRVLADLTQNFWDGMFPPIKRKKGRIRIIEWWQEKTLAALEKYKPFRFKEGVFRELKEILDEWDRFLEEKLPEHPSIFSLIRFLEETAEIEPEAKPEEKVASAEEPAPTTRVVREAPAPPEEISSPEEARRELNRLTQGLRKVSQFFRENTPEDPLGYRLLRTAVWLNLREPVAGSDGTTKIPPPPAQLRTSLVNLEQAGNWEQLLAMSEGRLGQFPLWLDLNRLSYAALVGLGRNEAAEAVAQETRALVKRYPGLLGLSFSDGTPFAGEETKKWLAEKPPEEKPKSKEEASKEREGEELEAFLSRLKIVARKEGLGQAVALLQERSQSGNGERARFLGRLGLAELFIEAKKLPLALLLLEEILNDLERFQLEIWDPPLALRALRTVWHGFRLSPDREHKRKVHEILAKIAQLDATAILGLLEEKV